MQIVVESCCGYVVKHVLLLELYERTPVTWFPHGCFMSYIASRTCHGISHAAPHMFHISLQCETPTPFCQGRLNSKNNRCSRPQEKNVPKF